MQDLLSFRDWNSTSMHALLKLALELKRTPEKFGKPLEGKSIVAIFEKPSLRTRVSFDIGINLDYVSICNANYLHDCHIRTALSIGANAICEKTLVLNP